jgi:hypothetical protein
MQILETERNSRKIHTEQWHELFYPKKPTNPDIGSNRTLKEH